MIKLIMLGRFCLILIVMICGSSALHAVNKITATCSSGGGEPGTKATVSLKLDSDRDLTALQISFPGLASLAELDVHSARVMDRAAAHSITAGTRADGSITLLIYAADLKCIATGSGEIASFDITLGSNPERCSIPV
ncbi:MAG: hypothetical protein NC230_09385 [Bacteroides sp.]|nr:hypothetical protein [Bacteroides sp.]